jgi:hypothetical protein
MTFERFIPLVTIIGLGLLLALIGVALAWRQRSKTPAAHEAVSSDKSSPDWVKNIAGSTGKTLTRTGGAVLPADAVVVMRDATSSGWAVEINGMRFEALKDMHDDRTASKVLAALGGLQQFAGIAAPSVNRELKATPVVAPSTSTSTQGLDPIVAQALAQSGPAPSLPLYPAPPNSILAQIETILQRNLIRYPELAHRKIHIGAAPDGSLLIEVDRQFYHHADEIAELPVRDFIKAAIHEWERTA